MKIPQGNIIKQPNLGEQFGDIWASWNLDLTSNLGKIRVSPQTKILMSDNADFAGYDADMTYPSAFVRTNALNYLGLKFWCLCDKVLFYATNYYGLSGWTQDATANTPTALDYRYSDIVEFNDSLLASGLTDISRLTAGTWVASWWVGVIGGAALTTGIPHPMCVGFNNLLLIGNGNVVASVDIAGNFNNTLITLPVEYQIVWIRSSNNAYWIGCRNKSGGRAKVFSWYGSNQNFDGDYKINGSECFSGVIMNELPYVVNERGELLTFNGSGFSEAARFPIRNYDYSLSNVAFNPLNITKNGMAVLDGKIYILVNAGRSLTNEYLLEEMLSGIWCFDTEIGLHHKYSITGDIGAGIMDYGSPIIYYAGALLTTEKASGSLMIGAKLTINHFILNIPSADSDILPKCGYFITSQIQSSSVEEMWQKIYVIVKKFLYSTDKVVIKYRTDKKDFGEVGLLMSATWTAVNTFRGDGLDFDKISAGDEITILDREGAGLSANVISITWLPVPERWEIVLDESITDASGSFYFKVSNWTKLGTDMKIVSPATVSKSNFELSIGKSSTWIQFKVVMFFKGKNEIDKLLVKSEPQLKII